MNVLWHGRLFPTFRVTVGMNEDIFFKMENRKHQISRQTQVNQATKLPKAPKKSGKMETEITCRGNHRSECPEIPDRSPRLEWKGSVLSKIPLWPFIWKKGGRGIKSKTGHFCCVSFQLISRFYQQFSCQRGESIESEREISNRKPKAQLKLVTSLPFPLHNQSESPTF